jgi:putative transposase
MPDDERFLLSVRRECLDHLLILHERQLYRLLMTYIVYFNQARPHQGLGQRIPVTQCALHLTRTNHTK